MAAFFDGLTDLNHVDESFCVILGSHGLSFRAHDCPSVS